MRKGINPTDKLFALSLAIFTGLVLFLVFLQISAPLRGDSGCTTAASVLSDLVGGIEMC